MVEKIMAEEYGISESISEMEDRELSSGETKELEREQLDFNSIFEEYEDEEDADLKIWNLYLEDIRLMEIRQNFSLIKWQNLNMFPHINM